MINHQKTILIILLMIMICFNLFCFFDSPVSFAAEGMECVDGVCKVKNPSIQNDQICRDLAAEKVRIDKVMTDEEVRVKEQSAKSKGSGIVIGIFLVVVLLKMFLG